MAPQMAFGIDHSGQKVFAGEIDLALAGRQESIAANGGDLAVQNSHPAFNCAGGRHDQAVFKNQIRDGVGHSELPDLSLDYFLASAR
jgi:hypothetical protein